MALARRLYYLPHLSDISPTSAAETRLLCPARTVQRSSRDASDPAGLQKESQRKGVAFVQGTEQRLLQSAQRSQWGLASKKKRSIHVQHKRHEPKRNDRQPTSRVNPHSPALPPSCTTTTSTSSQCQKQSRQKRCGMERWRRTSRNETASSFFGGGTRVDTTTQPTPHLRRIDQLLEFPRFDRFLEDVQSPDQFTTNDDLRKGRPVIQFFHPLPYTLILQDIVVIEFHSLLT